jgi:chromatin assembly factor 1 subunit A
MAGEMDEPPKDILVALGKRSLEDDFDAPVSTPDNAAPSDTSTPLTVLSTMASPTLTKAEPSQASASGSSNGSVIGDAPTSTLSTGVSNGAQPPAKRRKLTIREKEEKKQEKEAKEKAKAEKKAQKDQEDRLKAEQKAQREACQGRRKTEEERGERREKESKGIRATTQGGREAQERRGQA